ncbi:hypothetical protein HY639_01790 [Candidatus Woesearchaeota archaeon]|nr:hypothetical protein [Candidatus Woesearchaeota archaeon]
MGDELSEDERKKLRAGITTLQHYYAQEKRRDELSFYAQLAGATTLDDVCRTWDQNAIKRFVVHGAHILSDKGDIGNAYALLAGFSDILHEGELAFRAALYAKAVGKKEKEQKYLMAAASDKSYKKSALLRLGECAVEDNRLRDAQQIYEQVLTIVTEKDDRIDAHLALAKTLLLQQQIEPARQHLVKATHIHVGTDDIDAYKPYAQAIALCKTHAPPLMADLLEEATFAFPLHAGPFVQLFHYYQTQKAWPAQRTLLSRMISHEQCSSRPLPERYMFRDIAKALATDYFARAQINAVDLAVDKWSWGFECEHWIKVEKPIFPTVLLTAYNHPNTVGGYYLVELTGITQLGKNTYAFEPSDAIIQAVRQTYRPDKPYTRAETLEDYLEEGVDTYYNEHFIMSHGERLRELISTGMDAQSFEQFLSSIGRVEKYN